MSKIKLFQRSTVKNLILKFLCLITRMSPTRMIFLEGLSTNNRFIYFEWYRRQGDEASVGSTQSFLKGRPSMSKIKLFQRSTVKNLILKFLCLITRMSPTRMIFLEGLSTNNRFIYFEWYRRQGDEASVGSTQRHVIAFIIFFGNF